MIPMKRISESEGLLDSTKPTKRARSCSDKADAHMFSDASQERSVSDLQRLLKPDTDTENLGWIAAKVFMAWPLVRSKKKMQVTSAVADEIRRLDVEFRGGDVKYLDLQLQDTVRLSLKGARIEGKKARDASHLPFTLVFDAGFALMYVEKQRHSENDGTVVDTWQIREQEADDAKDTQENDWFATPKDSPDTESKPTEVTSSLIQMNEDVRATPAASDRSMLSVDIIDAGIGVSGQDLVNGDGTTGGTSNAMDLQSIRDRINAIKRGEKQTHGNERGHSIKPVQPNEMPPPQVVEVNGHINGIMDDTTNLSGPVAGKKKKKKKKRRTAEQATEEIQQALNPVLSLQAGFKSKNGQYLPLNGVKNGISNVCLAGVVSNIRACSQTRTGEWSTTISLVDPSNLEPNDVGFKVNCFTKKYSEWLPSPAIGHVLLLRGVKIATNKHNHTLNGVGYCDKLHWAAFDSVKGVYYHTKLSEGVPRDQVSDDGFGATYCPFFDPDAEELGYCLKLASWYRAVQEDWVNNGLSITISQTQGRQHQCIGDMEPNVFFDTTVEIISSCVEDGWLKLIVSDYSAHRLISSSSSYGQQAVRCSTSQVNDEQRAKLVKGTFWIFSNVRLRFGDRGYVEMDLYAAKYTQLYRNQSSVNLRLQELLKRKVDFVPTQPQTPASQELNSFLISDVLTGGTFSLVVELLFSSHQEKVTDLYVTDYTKNHKALDYRPPSLKNLSNDIPVFRIGVFLDETNFTKDMEVGAYYAMEKVMIVNDDGVGLKGRIFRPHENVQRIRSQAHVSELLRRKEELTGQDATIESIDLEGSHISAFASPREISELVRSRHTDQPKSTVKQIRENQKLPNKFRLIARIEDFWPQNLADFTVRRCKACYHDIEGTYNACPGCGDMTGKYVQWIYRFFFRISDEAGDTLHMSVSEEATVFLGDLQACDLHVNFERRQRLEELLQPLLGNLMEVHDAMEKNEKVEPCYGPYWDMAITSWVAKSKSEERVVAYGLTGCEIAH